jgi:hypothetical protein
MANETVEITLARALKLKNRIVGRLNQLSGDLGRYNSVQEGMEQPDIKAIYAHRQELAAQLVDLKTLINQANAPVQRIIYELAECKALLSVLASLNTRHGRVMEGYATKEVTYLAGLRKTEVDQEVRRLEAQADRLQEQLDTFNHATRLRVAAQMLEPGDGLPPG